MQHDDEYVDPFSAVDEDYPLPPRQPDPEPRETVRRQFHRPTALSEEVDALTGYDRAAMFAGYEAAIDLRTAAKQRTARLQSKLARLAARFETHGTQPSQADNERSRELAEIMDDIRVEYYRTPEMETVPAKRAGEEPTKKVVHLTVAEVEARAKASPRYKRFLDAQGQQREEYMSLKAELAEAWADYERYKEAGELIRLQLDDRKALIFYVQSDPHRRQPAQGA
jgi:rubrerythrin